MTTLVKDYRETVGLTDARITDQGFLRTTGKFGRAGVQEYYEDGKIIREFRPPSEVAKSVKSLSLQVVTLDHTDEPVTVDNRADHDIGTTGELEFKDGWVQGEIVIRDANGIAAAQTTHKELSSGYLADLVVEDGVFIDVHGWQGPKGKVYPYDRRQTNIRGNHQALVPAARAGSTARLDGKGKPCGSGHIAASKECHIGNGAPQFRDVPSASDFARQWTNYIESASDGIDLSSLSDDEYDAVTEAAERKRAQELIALVPDDQKFLIEADVDAEAYDTLPVSAFLAIYPDADNDLLDDDQRESGIASDESSTKRSNTFGERDSFSQFLKQFQAAEFNQDGTLKFAVHNDACSCESCSRSREVDTMPGKTKKVTVGDKEFEVAEEVADQLAEQKKRGDSAVQRADGLQTQLTQANTRVQVYESMGGGTQPASTTGAPKQDAIAIEAAARLDAYKAAEPYLPEGTAFEAGQRADHWKALAVQTAMPGLDIKNLHVDTAFDMLKAMPHEDSSHSYVTDFNDLVTSDRHVGQEQRQMMRSDAQLVQDAHKKEISDLQNAWRQPVGGAS